MYTDQRVEYNLGSFNLNTGAAIEFTPGHQPFRLRAVCIVPTTATDAASTVTITRRPTPGSTSSAESLGTMTLPNPAAVGNVYYKDDFDDIIRPGDTLAITGDGTPTAGAANLVIAVEPVWDHPSNNSAMIEKAT